MERRAIAVSVRSGVEAEAPFAPRKHGEDLALLRLALEDVSDRLSARTARRQSRPPADLADARPRAGFDLLQHDVAAGLRHQRIPPRSKCARKKFSLPAVAIAAEALISSASAVAATS